MSPLARARRRRRPRGRSAVVRDARALARIVLVARLGVAHRLGHVDLVRLAADGVRVAGALLVAEAGVGWVVAVRLVAGRLLEVVLGDLESLLDSLAALDQGPLRLAGAEVLLVVVFGRGPSDAGRLARGRSLLAPQQRVLGRVGLGVHARALAVGILLPGALGEIRLVGRALVDRHAGRVPARWSGEPLTPGRPERSAAGPFRTRAG